MTSFITGSLRTKLIVLFLVVSLVPVGIVGYISYDNARASLEKQALASLEAVTNSRVSDITHLIQLRQEQAKELAGTFLPRQLESSGVNDPEDIAKIQAQIESILEEMKMQPKSGYGDIDKATAIEIIGIWDTKGTIVANTNKELVGKKMPDHYLQGVKSKGTFFGGFNTDPLTEENFLIFLQAIRDFEDEKFAGAVLFKVSAQILNDITTDRVGLGDTGEIYLVNKDYFMITESRFVDDAILKQKVNTPIVKKCFAGEGTLGIYPDYRGIPIVGSTELMKDQEWCLLAEIDVAEAFAPVTALRIKVFFVLIIIGILVVIVAVAFSRGISNPIRKLADASSTVGKGDLDYKVEVKSRDELGKLEVAFNQMTDNLKTITTSRDKLNEEITERKKAEEMLEAANQQLKASEQQLKAANQQLQASEQQLKATNQQLRASEQQLRASNQQLKVNEQQLRTEITERKRMGEEREKHLHELQVFYKANIGREERIVELKKRIEKLEKKLSEKKS